MSIWKKATYHDKDFGTFHIVLGTYDAHQVGSVDGLEVTIRNTTNQAVASVTVPLAILEKALTKLRMEVVKETKPEADE